MPVISYPIPPYSNPDINTTFYQPQRFIISAITLGQTTTVTTSVDHDFVIGQLVRLIIPIGYGSRQLNEQQAYVISIPADDQVELKLNSYQADAFIAAGLSNDPQIMAIGDINSGDIGTSGRTDVPTSIPGSFINISNT